jgi:hypothetical protein
MNSFGTIKNSKAGYYLTTAVFLQPFTGTRAGPEQRGEKAAAGQKK